MSNEHAKREIMPIEEATVSKMRGIAAIVEVLEHKGKLCGLNNRGTSRRMLKKAVQQGPSERRGEAYASVR
jgi:hypothetical protein